MRKNGCSLQCITGHSIIIPVRFLNQCRPEIQAFYVMENPVGTTAGVFWERVYLLIPALWKEYKSAKM